MFTGWPKRPIYLPGFLFTPGSSTGILSMYICYVLKDIFGLLKYVPSYFFYQSRYSLDDSSDSLIY